MRFFVILKKLVYSDHIFVKLSSIKFNENLYSRSRAVQCGMTDGQTTRYNETKRPRKEFPTKEAGMTGNKLPLLVYCYVLAAKQLVSKDMV
jgi:hypothetical protein